MSPRGIMPNPIPIRQLSDRPRTAIHNLVADKPYQKIQLATQELVRRHRSHSLPLATPERVSIGPKSCTLVAPDGIKARSPCSLH
jgi:hypothetical protein